MEAWMIGPLGLFVFTAAFVAFGIWQKRKLDKYEREHPDKGLRNP